MASSRDAQLLALGLGRSAIGEWAEAWAVTSCAPRACTPCGYPNLTRNGRFMAAVLACGDGSRSEPLQCCRSVGHAEQLAERDPRDRAGATAAAGAGACTGRRWTARRSRKRAGIPVTTPARTLIDLADVAPRRTLERAIDEAEYLRLDCTGLAPRHGRRGSGTLSSVLAVHRPGSTRTRSELEEMFIALCDNHGLPRPEVNVHIEGYECDFVWREQRLIVETDGAAAHSGERRRARDLERDAELVAAGWRVIRITYERLLREPERVAEQVGRALTPSRRPAARGARRRP